MFKKDFMRKHQLRKAKQEAQEHAAMVAAV